MEKILLKIIIFLATVAIAILAAAFLLPSSQRYWKIKDFVETQNYFKLQELITIMDIPEEEFTIFQVYFIKRDCEKKCRNNYVIEIMRKNKIDWLTLRDDYNYYDLAKYDFDSKFDSSDEYLYARDCERRCRDDYAIGMMHKDKIGWLFLRGYYKYFKQAKYDFDSNDVYLYTDEFLEILKSEKIKSEKKPSYYNFLTLLIQDPDTPKSTLFKIAQIEPDLKSLINRSLGGSDWTDIESAYLSKHKIENADIETFEVFNTSVSELGYYSYAKDKNSIYCDGKKMEEADYESFTVEEIFAKDKNNLYGLFGYVDPCKINTRFDVNTIEMLELQDTDARIFKDRNGIYLYSEGEIFEPIQEIKDYGHSLFNDEYDVYQCTYNKCERIPDLDGKSLQIIDNYKLEDRDSIYQFGCNKQMGLCFYMDREIMTDLDHSPISI
jgi:hypothetical protein